MFVPKLVATDLDGTLLRSDLTVSERTLATFSRLERSGITLVFVTGRPWRWMDPVLAQTGRRGRVVCANGAVVLDGASGEVLRNWTIPTGTLRAVTTSVRETFPDAIYAVERGPRMLHEAGYPVRHDLGRTDEDQVSYAELIAEPVEKLLIRAPSVEAAELWTRCTRVFDDTVTATHSGFRGLIEVSAPGVTKATGLAWVAQHYGVDPGGVLAFGDMPNDIPMLSWAGRGVVVAGAHPEAAAVAHTVTTGNDADGVATYIDALLDEAEATTPR
ncbi:HAD family hydrolase [Cryptosporangium arvum]|uniref:HAD-superfamily hydrolase, subfamily IIB n=1 Tax=Cryptosporangium arvum DSM 44712 TaxID=927661 RepID=A0A010ZK72_9ACTN|nr:HAD family hydrolase [Cryptosporangium arvum]EXG79059.1 HAD-superfamily hydrolase, subfamily IIB [Cryptosporangium arvum DSM 44712]